MPLFLIVLFIVVPIAELYVIIQVGQLIGIWPTLALLLLVPAVSLAQATPPTTGAPPTATQGAAPPRSTLRPFAEVTRGAERRAGFFDTYQVKDTAANPGFPATRRSPSQMAMPTRGNEV